MEAEEELAKETIRAFTAGLHGDDYQNPFTQAQEAAEEAQGREQEPDSRPREGEPPA